MKRLTRLTLFAPLTLLAFAPPAFADLVLAPPFQNGVVLQQEKPITIWGKADAGEKVTIELKGQKKETIADSEGRWRVNLAPEAASNVPAELVASGKNTIRLSDVLVGEVWICSGQSNMAWAVKTAKDFEYEKAAANFPLVRQFKVQANASETPLESVNGSWVSCTPNTVGEFTATGYFFGREIHQKLNLPVGLINTSYGGTFLESWMGDAALKSDPAFAPVFKQWEQTLAEFPQKLKAYEESLASWKRDKEGTIKEGKPFTKKPPLRPDGPGSRLMPSSLFNAMVHPLVPCTVRGILWYQGENNAPRFGAYAKLFEAMIRQWRKDFEQDNLPFYFVQLANFDRGRQDPSGQQWAFLREAQASALSLPDTGMAVTIDIGEAKNIHFTNKQELGRRLSLIALALTYGEGNDYSGPVFEAAEAEGNSIRVVFTHVRSLFLKDSLPSGFELAGADRIFHPATAKVDGKALILSSGEVPQPIAVRYAWKNSPEVSLFNEAGLPAAPFRSDNWPATLEESDR